MSSKSDSAPEDRNPKKRGRGRPPKGKLTEEPAKVERKRGRPRKEEAAKHDSDSEDEKQDSDSEGEEGGKILLGSMIASVSKIRGKKLINIRERYGDGKLKPGKEGVSLSKEQFAKLLAAGPKILEEMKKDG